MNAIPYLNTLEALLYFKREASGIMNGDQAYAYGGRSWEYGQDAPNELIDSLAIAAAEQ